ELWELWERARARTLFAIRTAPITCWKSCGSALARERFPRPGPPPPPAGSPVGARSRANRSSGGTCHSTRRLLACQNPSTPAPVLQPDRIPERICATPPRQSGTYRVQHDVARDLLHRRFRAQAVIVESRRPERIGVA